MSAHTPGPWTVSDYSATAVIREKDQPGIAVMPFKRDQAEREANARLIAAAPDLLASVIELLEPLERASAAMVAQGKALDQHGEAAFDRARAAISLATGETPR